MTILRKATATDADAVAHLYLLCRKAAVPTVPPVAHADEAVIAWMSARIRNGEDCWLATSNDEVVALMLLEPGWLDQLYVHPAHTNQGIGADLVAIAKREQPLGLQLWTFQSNTRAHAFYERHGFVAVEQTDGSHNEEQMPDVRYAWAP